MQLKTEKDFADAVAKGAKVSVRWRKGSATWVIYVSGVVYMSGLDRKQAERITEETFPTARVDYSRA